MSSPAFFAAPSAIFAATHVMALGALRAIWEAGFAVPQTISVLAFDDL